ncbi:hypothetical protein QAD02_005629 [Eretmocerus hayati]|uniref:Uncharacterized protein n=1 Tax=Eretmocerus hayati TaxID=131215 RepID=A0ACC2NVY2_9HYME|nr:hypothetical protein QAD02_005629 [Eretmocerus hayati]
MSLKCIVQDRRGMFMVMKINAPPSNPIPCKENMELDYSNNGLTCRCMEDYVYHSVYDSCYEPFSQGPCPYPSQYIYRPINESVATCVENPCQDPQTFPYKDLGCFKLYVQSEACNENQILLVDKKTHQLDCADSSLGANELSNRMPVIIDTPGLKCSSGYGRNQAGRCKRKL